MTKKELLEIMENFEDDDEIFVLLPGSQEAEEVRTIETYENNPGCIFFNLAAPE